MLPELDDYAWGEVFGCAGEPGHQNFVMPLVAVPPGDARWGQQEMPITREDVAKIIGTREGENDGRPWLIVGRTTDGRFFFISAWCDYTGWDCRSNGESRVAATWAALCLWGLTETERNELNLPAPEATP